jgi:hypothetical protein
MDPVVTAEILIRRSKEKAQAAEHLAAALRAHVLDTVRTNLPSGGRAWLIGSLAWGAFGVRSDIDLVITGLTEDDETRLEWALIRSTDRTVDILRLSDLPLSFQSRVIGEGLEIHAAGN